MSCTWPPTFSANGPLPNDPRGGRGHCAHYTLVYTVVEETVYILGVFDQRRNR
jgi:hypothetical protein